MPDPSRMLGRQGHRVRAADEQVPGVQTQPDHTAGKNPLDIVRGLDHRADVRVHSGGDRAPPCDRGKSVEVGEQHLPAGVVQDRPRVIPVGPRRRGQDQSARAGGCEALEGLLDLGDRVVRRVMQHDRHKAADGP